MTGDELANRVTAELAAMADDYAEHVCDLAKLVGDDRNTIRVVVRAAFTAGASAGAANALLVGAVKAAVDSTGGAGPAVNGPGGEA